MKKIFWGGLLILLLCLSSCASKGLEPKPHHALHLILDDSEMSLDGVSYYLEREDTNTLYFIDVINQGELDSLSKGFFLIFCSNEIETPYEQIADKDLKTPWNGNSFIGVLHIAKDKKEIAKIRLKLNFDHSPEKSFIRDFLDRSGFDSFKIVRKSNRWSGYDLVSAKLSSANAA